MDPKGYAPRCYDTFLESGVNWHDLRVNTSPPKNAQAVAGFSW